MSGGVFTNDLEAGDLILIIQMQGADIAVSTGTVDNGFGDYTVPSFPQYDFWFQSDWYNFIDIWGQLVVPMEKDIMKPDCLKKLR